VTCTLAVLPLMNSCSAIWRLERPSTSSRAPLGRQPGAKVQATPAGQRLQCAPQRRGPKLCRGLITGPGGSGRLVPVAGAKQRLRQPPPAASHRIDVTEREGVDRLLPARRVGVTLEPGPLGFGLGEPTPHVHVVVDTSPVCLLHGRVGALQERATNRDGVGQRHSVTGLTSAFGTLGLDREPFHTNPGNVHYLVEVFNRVDGGKGAMNGRPRPIEVTLPGGQLGLPDRHIAIKELAGTGECDKVVQAFGGNRSPTGHLHREPFGGQLLCR
jgi:hypothetical protein